MRISLGTNQDLYYELYNKYKALNSKNKQEKETLPSIENLTYSQKALTPPFKFKNYFQSPAKRHEKSTSYILMKEKPAILTKFVSKEFNTPKLPPLMTSSSKSKSKLHIISLDQPTSILKDTCHTKAASAIECLNYDESPETAKGQPTETNQAIYEKPGSKSNQRKKFKHVLSKSKFKLSNDLLGKAEEHSRSIHEIRQGSRNKKLNIIEGTPLSKTGNTILTIPNTPIKECVTSSTTNKSKRKFFGCIPICF